MIFLRSLPTPTTLPLMEDTSVSLLERLRQRNDTAAWNRFVDLYAPLVHRWAVKAGLQPADAADLVQEVFVIVFKELPNFRYDPNRSFRAWLKTVALNQWRTRFRRTAPLSLHGQSEPEVADPVAAVWDEEYRNWLTVRALKLMETDFEPHVWQACWLTAAEGRPAEEVARQLGMSVGAVYAARCRVLARLRLPPVQTTPHGLDCKKSPPDCNIFLRLVALQSGCLCSGRLVG